MKVTYQKIRSLSAGKRGVGAREDWTRVEPNGGPVSTAPLKLFDQGGGVYMNKEVLKDNVGY